MTYQNKEIICLPEDALHQISEPVNKITPEIENIIANMKQKALEWEESRPHEISTALTAIQIGVPKQIVIFRDNFSDKSIKKFNVLINPKIVRKEGKVTHEFEGCLSVKDLYAKVPRHDKIRVRAKDEHGKEVIIRAKGFLARVLQHEIDHTQGVVFTDYVKTVDDFYIIGDDGELKKANYEQDVKPTGILRD